MKDKIVAGLLAIFLGGLGIHWFYLGRTNRGITYLLVSVIGGILIIPIIVIGIMALVDGIKFLVMDKGDFDKMYNSEEKSEDADSTKA